MYLNFKVLLVDSFKIQNDLKSADSSYHAQYIHSFKHLHVEQGLILVIFKLRFSNVVQ